VFTIVSQDKPKQERNIEKKENVLELMMVGILYAYKNH
jgi:hypothetical protein